MDAIQTKLQHQRDLIIEVLISLEYLINYPKYLNLTGNKRPNYLSFLYVVIRNHVVNNQHLYTTGDK